MSYSFFAFVNRMKYIQRWGLMRNNTPENLQEHCLQTAMIAHMLVAVDCKLYGGSLNPERACVYAMYHDAPEIITGDLPTPIKYFDTQTRESYRKIESMACDRLVNMLPEEFRGDFESILKFEESDGEYKAFIKAADKISAYLKCVEEENCGNREFTEAKSSLLEVINDMNIPSVKYFMENFVPAYSLSLDKLN